MRDKMFEMSAHAIIPGAMRTNLAVAFRAAFFFTGIEAIKCVDN